eukprot:UN23959
MQHEERLRERANKQRRNEMEQYSRPGKSRYEKMTLPITRTKVMLDKYKIKAVLNRSAFATVRQAICKKGKEKYQNFAIKIIRKKGRDPVVLNNLLCQVPILQKLDHPNVCALRDAFNTPNYVHVILDLCGEHHMLDHIMQFEEFNEKKAAAMIRQLSAGVDHMHRHNIVHRDLKPENILFGKTYGSEEPVLKIIDFALSRVYDQETPFTTICGSPEHTAPEVLTRYGYGPPVDWWGVGVIMYMLLSGIPPFL